MKTTSAARRRLRTNVRADRSQDLAGRLTVARGSSLREDNNRKRRVDRRLFFRVLAGAPVAAIAAVAGRGQGAVASLQDGTPVASPTACASTLGATPVASPVAVVTVRMTDALRFDPAHLTIVSGQTVTWSNESAMPHSATGDHAQNPVDTTHPDYIALPAGAEAWGSDILQPGQTYSHTFTVPGEYRYICIPHVLSGMRGSITVTCG